MFKLHRGFTIDSGAAEHVIPKGWIEGVPVRASAGSLRGVHYVAANGGRIPNLGEQRVPFWTPEGVGASWTLQVAQINKPLVSVAKLNLEGWRVVFDADESYIQHKRSGKIVALKRERGVFIVEAYLEQKNGQVFIRQGP